MSSSAEFSVREVIVAPGGEEIVGLTVRNIGPNPEVFSLVTTGLAQSWMYVDPATVALPPGSFETVRVALRPPRSWAVGAGPTPFGVRVVSHSGDDEVTIADGLVTVLGFDERRLHLAQAVQRSRRRAEFDLVLENTGNAQASCRLTLIDPTRRVKGKFQPPSLGVDPGMTQPTRLAVTSRRRRWRKSRSLPFFVQATQDGHPLIEVSGTLLQEPMISGKFFGRLALTAVACGALAGAWFGVAKPAIDDAAERAVARLDNPGATLDPSGVTLPGELAVGDVQLPNVTPTAVGAATVGTVTTKEAFDTRLEVSTALGEQATAAHTVEAGKRLRLSILLQNPHRDEGPLVLLRNGEIFYESALENFTDHELFGPFVFDAGDTITLQVSCRGIGDPTGTTCVNGATLIGTIEAV